MKQFSKKLLKRFFDKISVNRKTECWEWTASLSCGYGQISINTIPRRAHRISYEIFVGEIPRHLVIDHLCRNKKCVNPKHLELVTMRENVMRGIGPTAINKAKTVCLRGHLLSGDNLYVRPNGNRECRTCVRRAKILFRKRRKDLL